MYLVELKPGIETIYGSVAELTEAVRRGEVTEAAKVFHRARSEWAPITAHPKFREIVTDPRSGLSFEPVAPRGTCFRFRLPVAATLPSAQGSPIIAP